VSTPLLQILKRHGTMLLSTIILASRLIATKDMLSA
jgi:hypothetical protein